MKKFIAFYLTHLVLACAAQETNVWRIESNQTVRVGSHNELPRYSWAKLPVGAFEYAEKKLVTSSANWLINKIDSYGGSKYSVICLSTANGMSVRYAILNDVCYLLAGPDVILRISDVLNNTIGNGISDINKASAYEVCENIAYLFSGPKRMVLSSDFEASVPRIEAWLSGLEADKRKLLNHCLDPIKKLDELEQHLEFKVLTGLGALEAWNVTIVESDKKFVLKQISVDELLSDGSFSWGLVP